MTDPLSVVASIIAVVTAAGAVVKAIEKARRLTKCSTALLSLRNHVIAHQAFLTLSEPTMREMCSHMTVEMGENLRGVIEHGRRCLTQVEALLEQICGSTEYQDPSKQQFRAHGARFLRHSGELKHTAQLLLENRQALAHLLSAFCAHSLRSLSEARPDIEKVDQQQTRPIAWRAATSKHTASLALNESDDRIIRVALQQPSLSSNRARAYHMQHYRTTAPWLTYVFGILTYNYQRYTFTGRSHCDQHASLRSTTSATRFTYSLPRWGVQYAIVIACTTGRLSGTYSGTWSIKVPRVLPPSHPVWHALDLNDVPSLRRMLAARSVSPYDVSADTQSSLLKYALLSWRPPAPLLVATLIQEGADADETDETGMSPIAYAAKAYLSRSGGLVVKQCHDPSGFVWAALSRTGHSRYDVLSLGPVHRAVLGLGSMSLQQCLDENSNDVDEKDVEGATPLMWAIRFGSYLAIQKLLSSGCDPNASCNAGFSILHEAVRTGNVAFVGCLLERGARVNAQASLLGISGNLTPLMVAPINHDNALIVRLLIEYGAAVDAVNTLGISTLRRCIRLGRVDSAQCLLENGANPNEGSSDSPSQCALLMYAARRNDERMVHILIKHGAWTHVVYQPDGRNILHMAARYCSKEVFTALLAADFALVETEAADIYGWSPLEILHLRQGCEEFCNVGAPTLDDQACFLTLLEKARCDRMRWLGLRLD